ncbi:MAG: hypothetical protein ACU0B1_13860 [Thermohalobaculum sp.]
MENASPGGTGADQEVWKPDQHHTVPTTNTQAATRAIEAGLVYLPHPTDLTFILHQRLDLPERIWLAISSLLSLPPDDAEELAECVLCDLRAGPPLVTFWSVRDDARDWAIFASPAELRAYMAACWQRLPDRDRGGFLRTLRQKRRAA